MWILMNLGHNGRNVIKVVEPIIDHVLDFGFHVKQSRHTILPTTYDTRPLTNNAKVNN